jgi:hypothetical protein
MQRRDLIALLSVLAITIAMWVGLVYFVHKIWPLLPPAVALIGFILLAVAVIGYPIYALAQWSNRYLARLKKPEAKSDRHQAQHEE